MCMPPTRLILLGILLGVASAMPMGEKIKKVTNSSWPGANCNFPMYKQCDGRWGGNQIGSADKTICQEGCAMSSVAMFLAGRGASIDPGSLNSYLQNHGGYVRGDDIIWGTVDALGFSTFMGMESVTVDDLSWGLSQCHGIVVEVRGGAHWVLLTDYRGDGQTFGVNDPYFDQATYTFGEMDDFAVYH
eukprot:m.222564 g.222564  ORF g.222564 m.222564 type:complete len:188 (+) comp16056_c0_seq1:341-904(+)